MIDLKLSSDTWDRHEIEAITRVVESGQYTMGKEVAAFEKEFAEHVGANYAVMVNSGSSANLIMLTALMLTDSLNQGKNEIIVPSVSWSTTFFPVHQCGFTLKFVDVDLEDFQIDCDQVEAAINENTAAVLAVNLLGSGCDLERLESLCLQKGIVLLEDNCESFGARVNERSCGTFGVMGTFSFFFSHHLQTMEGGMIVTAERDLYDMMRSLRAHGWVRDLPEVNSFYKKTNDFNESFRFIFPAYCVRPLEFSGAIGRAQLQKWPKMFQHRRANAQVALECFEDNSDVILQAENGESSWFGFGFVLINRLKGKREQVVELLKSHGVESRPIVAGNFQRNPVMAFLNAEECPAPNADNIDKNGFFIGNDSIDLADKIRQVAELLKTSVAQKLLH